jgi:hypothetical protein
MLSIPTTCVKNRRICGWSAQLAAVVISGFSIAACSSGGRFEQKRIRRQRYRKWENHRERRGHELGRYDGLGRCERDGRNHGLRRNLWQLRRRRGGRGRWCGVHRRCDWNGEKYRQRWLEPGVEISFHPNISFRGPLSLSVRAGDRPG